MQYSEQIKSLNCYKEFKKLFMLGKFSQAYLFLCTDNITSSAFLLEIAKLIECERGMACGTCPSCKKVIAGTHPDILIYPKGKNFVVDDASEIYNTVQVKPIYSNYKIYIVNNFDQATEQAQNKMLKVIEEPPEGVIFLLAGGEETKILPTIKSRVQKFEIDKISKTMLGGLLNCDEETKKIALSMGDGFIGKTIEIANNSEFVKNYNNVLDMLQKLKKSEQIPYFSAIFNKNKVLFENQLKILSEFFRDMLMIKLGQNALIKNDNKSSELQEISREYSNLALVNILGELNKIRQKLYSNVNLVTLTDNMLLTILEVKFLCK